jgi:hypothetical protein
MTWKEPHPPHLPSPAEVEISLAKIHQFELKIREITSQIEELETVRATLQRDHDNHVSFIATFRRLPSEILGEIATFCWPNPWRLNQVSRAMREAINGKKRLWTTISIARERQDAMLEERGWEVGVCHRHHLRIDFKIIIRMPLFVRIRNIWILC